MRRITTITVITSALNTELPGWKIPIKMNIEERIELMDYLCREMNTDNRPLCDNCFCRETCGEIDEFVYLFHLINQAWKRRGR
jgi:hypothetical protein